MEVYKKIGVPNSFVLSDIDYDTILILSDSLKKQKKHVQSKIHTIEILKEETNDSELRKTCVEQLAFFKEHISKIDSLIDKLDFF